MFCLCNDDKKEESNGGNGSVYGKKNSHVMVGMWVSFFRRKSSGCRKKKKRRLCRKGITFFSPFPKEKVVAYIWYGGERN